MMKAISVMCAHLCSRDEPMGGKGVFLGNIWFEKLAHCFVQSPTCGVILLCDREQPLDTDIAASHLECVTVTAGQQVRGSCVVQGQTAQPLSAMSSTSSFCESSPHE